MRKTITTLFTLAAFFTPAVSATAWAQAFPSKPLKVLVPWPAAGSNDIVARLVATRAAEQMGQKVTFENRAGASGVVGTEFFAKTAQPDGYTLMVHSATHLTNGHIYKKLNYDTMSFVPVAMLAAQTGVLSVHPSLPTKNAREFIALAKSRPGQIAYSSSGQGSAPHMSMAYFASMAKIDLKHQSYRGGIPGVDALAVGEVQASIATIATVMHHLKAAKIRPIGVSSSTRSQAFPDIPTIAESGLPGFEMSPWIAMFAPPGTPAAVVNRLNSEMNAALKFEAVANELRSNSLDPIGGGPDQIQRKLKADWVKYGNLVKLTGADQQVHK